MSDAYSFSLDGSPVTVQAEPKTAALGILQDLGVVGVKAGCSPQALCGCCTVLVDGKPRLTCTLPVKSLAGKTVRTLASLPSEDRERLADAFLECGATQCGYCTPGIVVSAWALLQADPAPSQESIVRALNPHVCRCTGYSSIVRAIGAVGTECPSPRPEGRAIVLGERPYVDDLRRPGMLFGAVVLAPAARGTVAGLQYDATPGVTVLPLREVGDPLLHAGEIVAVVAAPDATTARRVADAVVVTVDPEEQEVIEEVVARARTVDGDVEGALAAAAWRVDASFRLGVTDPVYLEPEAALAVPAADGVVVYSQGHDAEGEAKALSAALGVPVRVRLVPSGGSYGGKEGILLQEASVRLALATGRPVRLSATHEEGMRMHRRRPGATVNARLGCDADGRGLVVDLDVTFDGGVDTLGADRMVAQAFGAVPYVTSALRLEARVNRTASAPTGPIRGAGGLPVAFAVERCLDTLARQAGIDPYALRMRNLEGEGAAVLGALGEIWAAGGVRGLGMGRVDGSGGARVVLTVAEPGRVEVSCNVPDLGQGRDEELLAGLVEASGLSAEVFDIVWGASELVGPGASGPVDEAARRAGEALARGGMRVGERYVGEATGRAGPGWAANLVVLRADGTVESVHTAVATGGDARAARSVAEGAAHMGLGVALSEEVVEEGGLPDGRFRRLGVIKPKGSPEMSGRVVWVEGAREVGEVAILGVPGAVANAIAAMGAEPPAALPMKETAAARGVGVRPVRAKEAGAEG